MTVAFEVRTLLRASPNRVFASSVSIDDHVGSMARSRERAIDGVTTGDIGLGQSVTWKARHLGFTWTMTSQVTEYEQPIRFVDVQTQGPFKRFRHEHVFRATDAGTEMLDDITFTAPLGALGWIAERTLLNWYMPRLIRHRNAYLKASLEAS